MTVIGVKLLIEDDELSQSYQKNQIIPRSRRAGIDISFQSSKPVSFQKKITYLINM